MKSETTGSRTAVRRARVTVALSLFIALAATTAARAEIATPEQKRACAPDLSEACRAVFDQ
jgi:hypothetical protein